MPKLAAIPNAGLLLHGHYISMSKLQGTWCLHGSAVQQTPGIYSPEWKQQGTDQK